MSQIGKSLAISEETRGLDALEQLFKKGRGRK